MKRLIISKSLKMRKKLGFSKMTVHHFNHYSEFNFRDSLQDINVEREDNESGQVIQESDLGSIYRQERESGETVSSAEDQLCGREKFVERRQRDGRLVPKSRLHKKAEIFPDGDNYNETGKKGPIVTERSKSHPSWIFTKPPIMIVKANFDSHKDEAFSFSRGDFFFIQNLRTDDCYEVVDTLKQRRGLVKIKDFQVLKSFEPKNELVQKLIPIKQPPAAANNPVASPAALGTRSIVNIMQDMSLTNSTPISISIPWVFLSSGYWTFQLSLVFRKKAGNLKYPIPETKHEFTITLNRKYSEFIEFLKELLVVFPVQAGYFSEKSRLFPFLPKMAKMDKVKVQETRGYLDWFLNYLIFDLELDLELSLFKFFCLDPKANDKVSNVATADQLFDASDALLDLINDFSDNKPENNQGSVNRVRMLGREERQVEVTFLLGPERYEWKTSENTKLDTLRTQIRREIGFDFDEILYCDESGVMIVLRDTFLLMKMDSIQLYCS